MNCSSSLHCNVRRNAEPSTLVLLALPLSSELRLMSECDTCYPHPDRNTCYPHLNRDSHLNATPDNPSSELQHLSACLLHYCNCRLSCNSCVNASPATSVWIGNSVRMQRLYFSSGFNACHSALSYTTCDSRPVCNHLQVSALLFVSKCSTCDSRLSCNIRHSRLRCNT